MKKEDLIIIVTMIFVFAGNAPAFPTLGQVFDGSEGTVNPAQVPYPSPFNDLEESGQSYVSLVDKNESSMATLLLELAGYKNHNTFGIYNPADADQKLEIFAGGDSVPESVTVAFNGTTATNLSTAESANIGPYFGFYLESPDEAGVTFYTDESLNGGNEHGLIYDTSVYTSSQIINNPTVVVAFEDLIGLGDRDYNDMVVGITNVSVSTIPAPGAVLLSFIGVGLVGWVRRRRTL